MSAVLAPAAPGLMRRFGPAGSTVFGAALFALLLVLNLLTNPQTFSLASLPVTIGFAAPVILAAFAVTPTLLMGNGGIDLSIGPLIGLVNVVTVAVFVNMLGVDSPVVLIPVALATGALVGAVNGLLVGLVRIQPIVATLGMYLVASGVSLLIAPTPGGQVPPWLASLAEELSIVPIAAALLLWFGVTRLPFYEHLMAYGGDERAAFSSGVSVRGLRIAAFTIGGVIAGLGGLSLSAVLGSADPTVGANYTTLGIAAAALGGVSLAGGEGGMLRALLGALTIFLLQNLLTFLNVSTFLLQVAYGTVLVLAVAVNGRLGSWTAKVRSR